MLRAAALAALRAAAAGGGDWMGGDRDREAC